MAGRGSSGVDLAQTDFVQVEVDRLDRGVNSLVVGGVRQFADADHLAGAVEQSAPAAPECRFPGHFDIGRALEAIKGRDPSAAHRWVGAMVAADAEYWVVGAKVGRAGDGSCSDEGAGADRDQADVAIVGLPGDEVALHGLGAVRRMNLDLDRALASGLAEDVAAGQHQGVLAVGVDDCAAAERITRLVFNSQFDGRSQGKLFRRSLLRRPHGGASRPCRSRPCRCRTCRSRTCRCRPCRCRPCRCRLRGAV